MAESTLKPKKEVPGDIKGGGLIQRKDKSGNSPLHVASKTGSTDVIKALLELEPDLEGKNDLGQSPLYLAVSSGSEGAVRCLLEAGADINTEADDGTTLWHVAASLPSGNILKTLISGKAALSANKNKSLKPESSKTLTTENPKIKEVNKNTHFSNKKSIKIPAQGHIKNKDNAGKQLAKTKTWNWEHIYNKVDDIVNDECLDENMSATKSKKINKPEVGFTLFDDEKWAFEKNKKAALAAVLNRGLGFVDVYEKDDDGMTIFHKAVNVGAEEAVERLLKMDVDVNESGPNGVTPILMSADGSLKLVERLIEAGADFRHEDDFGRTALYIAANKRNPPVVKKMLDLGLDPNKKCNSENTPLHAAAMVLNNSEVVSVLIKNGAKKNIKNFDGLTAFQMALGHSDPTMLKLLT